MTWRSHPDAARAVWQPALAILTDLDHPDADAVRARLDDLDRWPAISAPGA